MIYSNYFRSYNNMVSRMSMLNNANNYMSALSGMNNNSHNSNKLLNEFISRKQNEYVNNIKEYSKYNKESKEFYNKFKEKFSELKDSASKLKSYSSDSVFVKKYESKNTEKTALENNTADSKKVTEDQNTNIINAVEKFASNYNDAVTFLKNNSDKSQKISDLAQSYTNIFKYNKSILSGIGINVDANGKLTVDKDKLANAIRDNKNEVRNALGDSTSGVANKVYNKTTVAMIQSKELYPASKLKNDYINNTYFYNPNNSSILQANQMYSSGLFLNLLL